LQDVNAGYQVARNMDRLYPCVDPIQRLQEMHPVIVDYGSNFGAFSLTLAQMFPNATVFSIESGEMQYNPDPRFITSKGVSYQTQKKAERGLTNLEIGQTHLTCDFFERMRRSNCHVSVHLMMSFIHWLDVKNYTDFRNLIENLVLTSRVVILELPCKNVDQYNRAVIDNWYEGVETPAELLKKVNRDTKLNFKLIQVRLAAACSRPIFVLENTQAVVCGRSPEGLKYILTEQDKKEPLNELRRLPWTKTSVSTVATDILEASFNGKPVICKTFRDVLTWPDGGPVEESTAVRLDVLRHLKGVAGVPEYLAYDSYTKRLYTSHCGCRLTKANLPADWKVQLTDLYSSLWNCGVLINDFKLENLTVRDKRLSLVDFGADALIGIHCRTSTYLQYRESETAENSIGCLIRVLSL